MRRPAAGVFMLVPLRKLFILDYKLPYPSGTATGERPLFAGPCKRHEKEPEKAWPALPCPAPAGTFRHGAGGEPNCCSHMTCCSWDSRACCQAALFTLRHDLTQCML